MSLWPTFITSPSWISYTIYPIWDNQRFPRDIHHTYTIKTSITRECLYITDRIYDITKFKKTYGSSFGWISFLNLFGFLFTSHAIQVGDIKRDNLRRPIELPTSVCIYRIQCRDI